MDTESYTMTTLAHMIVDDIVADFCDRRGLRQAWESIDEDIAEAILNEWKSIVEKHIESKYGSSHVYNRINDNETVVSDRNGNQLYTWYDDDNLQ
jgi:predicted lipoprotein with Yx(FWY)xxD motif